MAARALVVFTAALALAAFGLVGQSVAEPTAAAPTDIALHQQGHGWLLSDAKGMTLYTFARDENGVSACNAVCLKAWPAMVAAADAKSEGEWSVITRDDNSKQWAFRGRPLYFSTRDEAAGDTNGDDFNNQWRVAFKPIPTPPGIGISKTLMGQVLADTKNLTLYAFDKDKPDGSGCDVACERTWMPVAAPGMAHPIVDWTVVTRPDGGHQWAFRGHPVYRYAGDVHPYETSGDDVAKGWHAVVLEPPPPMPAWMTLQESDAGELLADAAGKTLYAFNANRRGIAAKIAFDRPQDWIPVVGAADAKGVGNWSLSALEDGRKQWTYRGMPIFTNVNDEAAGDILGVRSGDRRFAAIMRSGTPMQGTGQ